jgi:hypothetical protein
MLALCTGCSRHVRHGEAVCPFCRAAITTTPEIPARRVGRTGRAAFMFGVLTATACGGAQTNEPIEQAPPDDDTGSQTPLYGEPAPDDSATVNAYGSPAPEEP